MPPSGEFRGGQSPEKNAKPMWLASAVVSSDAWDQAAAVCSPGALPSLRQLAADNSMVVGRVECYASLVSAALQCTSLIPLAECDIEELVGSTSRASRSGGLVGPATQHDIGELSIAGLNRFLDFAASQLVHGCERHFSKADAVLFAAHHSQSVNEVRLRRLRDHISEQIVHIDAVMQQLRKAQQKIKWRVENPLSPTFACCAVQDVSARHAGCRMDESCASQRRSSSPAAQSDGPLTDAFDRSLTLALRDCEADPRSSAVVAAVHDSDSVDDDSCGVQRSRSAVERIVGQLADLDHKLSCCLDSVFAGLRATSTCGADRGVAGAECSIMDIRSLQSQSSLPEISCY
mmetsp:Transcript_53620/g.121960  ORF Transcript_53620/g.121960 Transcript_53620/m.121960 type:complete len:347 (-) Transcript_53620:25-1065(-)